MSEHRGGRTYGDADRQFIREFGARVRARRLEVGMEGPLDLARAMGQPEINSSLSAIERGAHFPRPLLLMQIAKALEVSASYLLGDLNPDGDYHAGYRAALADLEEATHASLKELRQKGQS